MKSMTLVIALLLAASTAAFAQSGKVQYGAKIFIAPMEGELHGYIAAEILKRELPVKLTTEESEAEFILAGSSHSGDNKWYHTIYGGRDSREGNLQLISIKDKALVWAGEAGDRSFWWGNLKRGGQRKVADRLVGRMKKDLFEK
ncbi:MAG: hypothetical protein ACREAB_12205 [Blastocatellia bacterium]